MMFTGMAFLAILFQAAIFSGVVVFAVKLVRRLTAISEAQKSIAESQAQMVQLLSNIQQKTDSQSSS